MWSPKQHLLRLTKSLRRARSVELPKDDEDAINMLLPMIFANQHKSIADLLAGATFNVNFVFGRAQRTALHMAANCGHVECLLCLLKHGSDPNIQDIAGTTALHLAAKNGQKRCIEKLLEYGASPGLQANDGTTALHWLATNGRHEMLGLILPYTKDIDLEDKQGHTALHAAARNGHRKTMECLIDAGADFNRENSHGLTPLHGACFNGQRDAISLLLSKSAMLKYFGGQSPIELCLQGGYGVAAELLLEHSDTNMANFVRSAVYKRNMDMEKVTKCMQYFCTRPAGKKIAENLIKIMCDCGLRLLCLSSNSKRLIAYLMRAVKILLIVWKFVPEQGVSSDDDAPELIESCFNNLEPLWKSTEDWLILFRDENETSAPRELSCEEGHEDIFPQMAERISGMVHVFYQCISCVEGQKHHRQNNVRSPQRFSDFIKRHVSVLQRFVKANPTLIFENFSFLLDDDDLMSYFIDIITSQPFEDRYRWFYEHLDANPQLTNEQEAQANVIKVNRTNLFEDSCEILKDISSNKLKGHVTVQFAGEEGLGDGVLREWLSLLSSEILNPQYGLFSPSSDGCSFQPNRLSAVNPDHLAYFKFAGRILGLALYRRQLVSVSFTSSFYKHLLGTKVTCMDVTSIDPEYAKNLQWILDNDITDLGLELSFVVETDVFGVMQEIELIPNGANISVSQENKEEYVQLVTELRMTRGIQAQIDAFRDGFYEFIPASLVQIFSALELDVMLSGSPEVDIKDWKALTTYTGAFSEDHQVIRWFWDCVDKMESSDRAFLLQFVTGCSRLPPSFLSHHNAKFVVVHDSCSSHQLPTASTCMNMLKLPEYDSYEVLEEKLLIAIRCGNCGYAFT